MSTQHRFACLWGMICTQSSIDQEKNNVSLFNVIENINVPQKSFDTAAQENKKIVLNINHEIVFLLRKNIPNQIDNEDISFDLKIECKADNGEVLYEVIQPITFPGKARRFRNRIILDKFLLNQPGDYCYDISFFDKSTDEQFYLYSIPIEVTAVQT